MCVYIYTWLNSIRILVFPLIEWLPPAPKYVKLILFVFVFVVVVVVVVVVACFFLLVACCLLLLLSLLMLLLLLVVLLLLLLLFLFLFLLFVVCCCCWLHNYLSSFSAVKSNFFVGEITLHAPLRRGTFHFVRWWYIYIYAYIYNTFHKMSQMKKKTFLPLFSSTAFFLWCKTMQNQRTSHLHNPAPSPWGRKNVVKWWFAATARSWALLKPSFSMGNPCDLAMEVSWENPRELWLFSF